MSYNPTQSPIQQPSLNQEESDNAYDTLTIMLMIFFVFCVLFRNIFSRRIRIYRMRRIGVIVAQPEEEIGELDFSNFIKIIPSSARNQNTCVICLDEFEDDESVTVLPQCHHIYHRECINKWLNVNQICPICRCSIFPS